MLKILQDRLQQYMDWELPDVQTGFRKRWRHQRSNCQQSLDHGESKEIPEKTSVSFTLKPLTCVDHNKLWKILQEMGIPDHLICLLRNLYAGLETTNQTWNKKLVQNWERSTSRLYIVTLLIQLICRVRLEKYWAGWIPNWNQDCQEKYQQPQIHRWYHSKGIKQRGTN